MNQDEKRSQDQKNAQTSLLPCLAVGGVGARQARPAPLPGGGGYLDVCNAQEVEKKSPAAKKNAPPADPRLDELRRMGLQRAWVAVAEEIGVDSMLAAWRILDADPSSSYDGTTLRVPLRAWRTYLRYQRNQFIRTLGDLGLLPAEIQRRLLRQMGERISLHHIKRLLAKA